MRSPRPVVALEISPLGERHYTGIANVTRMLARELIGDATVEPTFMMGRAEVPVAVVEDLLALSGGDILWWLVGRLDAAPQIAMDPRRAIVGVYPSTKSHRRLFPFEVLIVHDLTTIVTPQFHTPEAVDFWQRQLLPDMMSSDLLVAVSEATAIDIRTYFPQTRDIPCLVAPEASCGSVVPPLPDGRRATPFILVLGTLEPRKNIAVVLDMIVAHRVLLEEAAFVFVGRWGWGTLTTALIESYGLTTAVEQGRIAFTGFVADVARDQLLATAIAVIYPSLYEGFGLPILEAMQYGTPVITTTSTSLPEVGGDLAIYFDPQSTDSLLAATRSVIAQAGSPGEVAARARRVAWATSFSWAETYRKIRDGALELQACA